ncbi:MAG: mycofactocin oligosaccharide methyltransferase MftM [Pseudonocardia sp.]
MTLAAEPANAAEPHPFTLGTVSNDLAGRIALEQPGIGPAEFERRFVSVVEGLSDDRLAAWTAFYRNTLAALAGAPVPGGTNAGMAPVHARAVSLAAGPDVLELGCCFGFLSLRLAAAGHRVTAVDLCPGTVALLREVSPRLGVQLNAVVGDATAVGLADGCADTVYAVHLLEHLPPDAGDRVLAEMRRLARRRVVVAVPFEDQPNPTWGHVRRFDLNALRQLGAASGARFEVAEHHGGWLVMDRQAGPMPRSSRTSAASWTSAAAPR